MRKIILTIIAVIFAVSLGYSQITTLWQKSVATSSLPSWFDNGSLTRGLSFGNNHVYIVSRNGGNNTWIYNAATGDSLGKLDATGIAGGTYLVSSVGVSTDGVIFVCNLTTSIVSSPFKVYKYTTESSAPAAVINYTGTAAARLGDKFTVTGSTADNSIIIWAASASTKEVYKFTTTDNGATFTATIVPITIGVTGLNTAAVGPLPNGNFYYNCNGQYAQKFQADGTIGVGDTIPGTIIGTGSNSIKYITTLGSDEYIVTFAYGTGKENGTIVRVPGGHLKMAGTVGLTPILGTNSNGNGTGDVSVQYVSQYVYNVYVLSTNNGFGAYQVDLSPYISIDGDLSDPRYITVATKLNGNNNWGPNIDVSKIVYYPDMANGQLYIGIQCKADVTNYNEIGLMIGLDQLAGVAAGTPLGGAPGEQFMGNATNPNFKADFPVSYMLALNPASNANDCYVNGVNLVGTRTASYLGNCMQAGSFITGPGGAADFWAQNTVTFAFNNSGAANKGFEIKIPFTQLGAGVTSEGNVQLFAFVVSPDAYFSDITVPGNISTDPGFNADFNTLTGTGGPFHTSLSPLPVELTSFTANMNGNSVSLNWKTSTELNNNGFEIERKINSGSFVKIGFISGAGNSNSVHSYSFTDSKLPNVGKYSYRLKQVDNNGQSNYSNIAEINYTSPVSFSLSQNYPNPFNPSTIIAYSIPKASNVKLLVYNAIGQNVMVLENGYKEAGNYNVTFNASALSSGLYFYKIEAGQFSQTRKMMLLK